MTTFTNTFSLTTKRSGAPASSEAVNHVLRDVELLWAKLDPEAPVAPFSVEQWELTVHVPLARKAELEPFGKVKTDEQRKTAFINLKKKATDREGNRTKPVQVVDSLKQAFDSKLIGNGSKGNVVVLQKPYQIKTPQGKIQREGISTTLLAVQVTELVRYEKRTAVDLFETEGGAPLAADEVDPY